jgi:hypothetical protein
MGRRLPGAVVEVGRRSTCPATSAGEAPGQLREVARRWSANRRPALAVHRVRRLRCCVCRRLRVQVFPPPSLRCCENRIAAWVKTLPRSLERLSAHSWHPLNLYLIGFEPPRQILTRANLRKRPAITPSSILPEISNLNVMIQEEATAVLRHLGICNVIRRHGCADTGSSPPTRIAASRSCGFPPRALVHPP